MWQSIVDTVRAYPQIIIFLAIAIGYYIGKIKIFGFNLGSTAGVLIAALVLGQINVSISPLLKAVAFALFIFTIGYKVGPQFFSGMKKDGIKYLWISLFVGTVALLLAIALGKFFGFGKGLTAGLLGGALTQSAVIGTAEGAIKHLSISNVAKATMESNVAIAYAITYIFGTAGLVVFYKLIPKIMKIDLKKEARKLEEELSGSTDAEEGPEFFNWDKRLNLRVFKVTNINAAGKTVHELEALFPGKAVVDKLKRGNELIDSNGNTVIQTGDILAIVGKRAAIVEAERIIGQEIEDKDAEHVIGEIINICVLKKDAVGKTLGDISKDYGHGCFLRRITRQGHELPLAKNVVVHKCDVLKVAGAKKDVEKLIGHIGYPERPTVTTDLIMIGVGCVLGTLIGLMSVKIAGIPLTLGVGGGVLISGLIFGWLRAVHPTFGQIPSGAQWVFTDLGLNLFIACVGLIAGPKALNALHTTGGAIFFAGIILTLVPHIMGIIFGRVVLKLNPVLLFGALTGAGTVTAALNALKEEADSTAPAIGYTVCYAFGNVILTIWGAIIVSIM
ncbi:MAG: aspartate-alanine antiporter [Candidatus Omnitrophica bacterium]|nr:aspartate-alanine antiporter [Candidatus Omnitrophota bacterium]